MRLSSEKAAYVAVSESSVVGNPEFAPNDTGASGPRFSAAPTALRSYSGLIPSPSGLGSRLAAGPPPDFLWNMVASVSFMRLSSWKGAHAGLSKCKVAGKPGPGLASMAILQCHCSLNLPQASQLLG